MRAAVAIRVNVFFISYLPFIVVKPNWLVTVHLSFSSTCSPGKRNDGKIGSGFFTLINKG